MHTRNAIPWFGVLISLIVSVSAVSHVWPGERDETNLAPNPGFESIRANRSGPSEWQFTWKYTHSGDAENRPDKQQPDFAVDESELRGGRRSVRVGVLRPQDDGVLTAPLIPVDPAVKIYRASVWIKTRNVADTTARLAAVSLGENGKWLGANYSLIVAKENHDWRRYVGFFTPARGTKTIRLRLWMNFERAGTATAWFDDVALEPTDMTELPPLEYVDPSPTPPVMPEDISRGYVPFVRPIVETIYPATVPRPEELGKQLQMIGFPSEYEAAAFCVRALEDIPEMVFESTALESADGGVIPGADVRVNPVQCLVRVGQTRWGPLADKPLLQPVYVEETNKTSVANGTTRQIWVTVSIPADASAGDYRGKIILRTLKSTWEMPVGMRVYPFGLPEVKGVAFGMYSRLHEDDTFMDRIYADMRAHGMTTVGLCCALGAGMEMADGKAKVRFDETSDWVRAMRAYQKAGFPEPVVWLMGSDVLRFALRQGPLESDEFAVAYRAVIEAVLEYAKASGWPDIIFQPVDEPFEHTSGLSAAKRCLEIMKTIPGLRTEEDGPNGNPDTLDELYDLCDVIVYHDGPWVDRKRYDAQAWEQLLARARADGKTIWFYNVGLTGYHPEAMRFGYGFGLWLARGTGVIEWAYMFRHGRGPEDSAYAVPNTMFFRYPRTGTHTGGPSIGWEATREGVQDYKLLRLFQKTLTEAKASDDVRRVETARRWEKAIEEQLARIRFDRLKAVAGKGRWTGSQGFLEDGTQTISGQFKMDNGWSFHDYDKTRRLLADAIMELNAFAASERRD